MKAIPLRRLLDKRQVGALLEIAARLSASPVTLGLADARGKWLAMYPAAPADDPLVQRACDTEKAVSDERATAVPLTVEDQLYGILYCSPSAQVVSETLVQALEMLIQGALTQKSLARETLDRYREINLLYRVHETIGSLLELSQVIRRVLEESIRIIKADGGSVLLGNNLTDQLDTRSSVGLDIAQAEEELLGRAFSDKTFCAGKPGILNDIEHYVRPHDAQGVQLVSLLSAPLKANEKVLGVITLGRTRTGSMFTAGDQKLLTALASQAGIAVANAREVEAREQRLRQQIEALRIEIDEKRKQREVYAITESEYFAHLQEDARQMRAEFDI